MLLEILHDIVNYMREHPEVDVISSDNPRDREIGWTAISDDFPKSWRISVTQLQRDISEDEKVRLAAKSLTSAKGRREVIDILSKIAKEEDVTKGERGLADFIGNPPVPPPPPPPRTRFQIIDDD